MNNTTPDKTPKLKTHRQQGDPPPGELLYLINLQKHIEKLKALQRRLSAAEELVSCLIAELEEIIRQIPSPAHLIAAHPGLKFPTPPVTAAPNPTKKPVRPRSGLPRGVHTVDVSPRVDGTYRIQIEGRNEILLPPKVGALANKLRDPNGVTSDEYIPWKSAREIAGALKEQGGAGSKKPDSVKQLVYRLRRELEENGEDPRVILACRGGYRFALYKLPPVTIDDQR
jgi:hypothetical protein